MKSDIQIAQEAEILQEISMPLLLQIICWLLYLITISSREMNLALIQDRSYGNAVLI